MITAVMIENRISEMYWRNAVRLPIGMSPLFDAVGAQPQDRDGATGS